jgi:hypothetical protein
MEPIESIETPQLFLKPFTAGLVEKPLSVTEREVDLGGFRAMTVDIETAPAPKGKVDF